MMTFFFPVCLCVGETCQHWMHYSDATKTREGWARALLEEYRSNMEMLKNAISGQSQCSPQHGEIPVSLIKIYPTACWVWLLVTAELNSRRSLILFQPSVHNCTRPGVSFIKVCTKQVQILSVRTVITRVYTQLYGRC